MQKKHLYPILLFIGLLLGFLPVHAHHTPHTDAALEAPPPCNLPAPTNLQMNQPNPLQATYTWNAVPGAAGYGGTITNLSNGGSANFIVTGTTITFSVQPGAIYHFRVAAYCLLEPPEFSKNYAERTDQMESIVIELVVMRTGCVPSGHIATLLPGQTFESASLSNGSPYFIEMTSNNGTARVEFQYMPTGGQSGNGAFQVRGIEGTPWPDVRVFNGLGYVPPSPSQLVYGSNARVSIPNKVGYFGFPTANSIMHFSGSDFSSLNIYSACGIGEGRSGADADAPASSASTAQAALDNILPVNPFTSDLTLHCAEHPVQAVTARLFDVSGRVQLQREIHPEEFAANTCTLATADLPPGMYFLCLESAPGVYATHKVVKL